MRTSELNPINCLVWHIVSINVSSIIIFVVVVIFFFNFIYLFIFGCVGSLFLCMGFL